MTFQKADAAGLRFAFFAALRTFGTQVGNRLLQSRSPTRRNEQRLAIDRRQEYDGGENNPGQRDLITD